MKGQALERAGAALGWPVGMGLATWRYLWRTTPVYRMDETVERIAPPPAVATALCDDRLRRPADGTGPLVNRRYRTAVCASQMSGEELIRCLAEQPNRAAPREVAVFRKTKGTTGRMDVGDEYVIRMPGPWDGPIRVVDRTTTSFRFATLRGHMESGQIEFRAMDDSSHLIFEIESWASSGDELSAFLYDPLRLSKEIQLNMWIHFLQRVVRTTRGRMTGGVHVFTYSQDEVSHG